MRRRSRLLLQHGRLLIETLAAVVRVRFDLSFRKEDRILPVLRAQAGVAAAPADGVPFSETLRPRGPLEKEIVAAIWAVRQSARLVPGATCLTQALAGQKVLARRGVISIVRIGVRRGNSGAFEAHAWLVHDELTLLGGAYEAGPAFTPISDLSPNIR